MKILLILAALLLNSTLFAKEITVFVLEGWKSKPLANYQVTLKSNVGRVLFEIKSDDQGKVVFTDLTYGVYTLETSDIGNNFEGTELEVKLKNKLEVTLLLRPTRAYRLEQMALEDSIYGKASPFGKKSEESEGDLQEPQSQSEEESALRGPQDTGEGEETAEDIETQTEFPGGEMEMKRYIEENVIYPEISREYGDQGRIYIVFVVEPDGVITHVRVFRGVSPELDEEAMRLVRSMPKWTPGSVNGENVRSQGRLPITFTLQ